MLAPYERVGQLRNLSCGPATTVPTSENSDSDTWMLATPLPLMDPFPASEGMNSDSASSSPEPEITSDHEESQVQLNLFRKLGFSASQVHAARLKLGLNSDTNTVLGELVLAGVEQEERNYSGLAPRLPSHKSPASLPRVPIACASTQQDECMDGDALKPIVIDGSNVAMSHGNKVVFSCLGIQLAVNFFLDRGHTDITVFVPLWRREQPRPDVPITDQHILRELEKRKILVFTPSRRVAGKRVVCYDDRFIVKLACESDGIIVSNDTYRDLQGEKPEWKRFIEDRLLMYSFVNDRFMVPDDPLGRRGPTLENFLRKTPRVIKRNPCPYGKKCTYGIKCKFSHPERPKQSNRTLADELREKAKKPASSATPHKYSSPASVRAGHSPPLEEILENKLHLDPPGAPVPQWRAEASENMLVLVGSPQKTEKSRKHCLKKERHSHSHTHTHSHSHNPNSNRSLSLASADSFANGSPEYLDSGLGSYEGHPERHHPGDPMKPRSLQNRGQYYPPPPCNSSQSCPCFPHLPPPMPPAPTQPQANLRYPNPNHVPGSAGSHGLDMSYFPQPCYPPYASQQHAASLPQHNMTAYGSQQPGHSFVHHPGHWSAPYPQGYTQSVHREPIQHHSWGGPMPPPARSSPPGSGTREEVRKKLMAIFNGRLVDRAMDMFPQLLDPQRLAAEILTLQSQEGIL
ncbi:ribonuclease ZC3H12A [Sardina pilchardus]|uniref:ribonuclease ZC3H12A n=1 Tax=Sardina pilchardus TaxID=27697 RepID=UPI002E166A88